MIDNDWILGMLSRSKMPHATAAMMIDRDPESERVIEEALERELRTRERDAENETKRRLDTDAVSE